MKRCVFLLALLLAVPAHAVETDKRLHFVASVPFGVLGAAAIMDKPWSKTAKVAAGTAIGTLPGLAKEIYDSQQEGNRFDVEDLAYDIAGALAGSVLAVTIHHLTITPSPQALTVSGRW